MAELRFAEVSASFKYDPETGKIFSLKTGRELVARRGGYIYVKFNGTAYGAHRIAWLLFYGTLPQNSIDHIDGDKANNRISNLRDVPQSTNLTNKRLYKNNKTGASGVYWCRKTKKWRVRITVLGKKHWIGSFVSKDEAVANRTEAIAKLGYHPNHGQQSADR